MGNKKVPLLRLYRYKEAFSLEFVNRFLDYFDAGSRDVVFDPFAGMGTTTFAAMLRGVPSIGVEKLPVAAFVASTLPSFAKIKPGSIIAVYDQLQACLDSYEPSPMATDVPLISRAFSPETLLRLRQWKTAINTLDPPLREVFLLLLLAILEQTSYTSNDGQFLRLKRGKRPPHPDEALRRKLLDAETDLVMARQIWPQWFETGGVAPKVYEADARDLRDVEFDSPPTILNTSPPYVNRYDYTRSYCLELCFHFVKNFKELRALRHSMLRSHIESKLSAEETPPHPVVAEVVENLKQYQLNNPRIPHMLVAYFIDMESAIRQWGRVMAPGGRVAVAVDNVRFEGETVPVDRVLSEMAEKHGFAVERIIVARYKGNSSQQMGRYGRAPVRESILVWRRL